MKRIFTLIIVLALSVSLFAACGDEKINGNKKFDKDIIGTIKDASSENAVLGAGKSVEVSQADFNIIYRSIYSNASQYAQYFGDEWLLQSYDGVSTIEQAIKQNTYSQLQQLVAAKAVAKNEFNIDEKIPP